MQDIRYHGVNSCERVVLWGSCRQYLTGTKLEVREEVGLYISAHDDNADDRGQSIVGCCGPSGSTASTL